MREGVRLRANTAGQGSPGGGSGSGAGGGSDGDGLGRGGGGGGGLLGGWKARERVKRVDGWTNGWQREKEGLKGAGG